VPDGFQPAVDAFSLCPDGSDFVYGNHWHLGILRCRPKSFLGGARATGVWVHPDDARALWFPAVREASRGAVVLQLDKRVRLSASQSNSTMLQGIVKLC
jgi:hypothetical protein